MVIEQMIAAARAGGLVLTVNRRLARRIRQGHDRQRLAEGQGQAVWPTPQVLPFSAWLHQLWDAHLEAGPAPLLLSARQEEAVWRGIVQAQGQWLASPGEVAGQLMAARKLMVQWRIAKEPLQGEGEEAALLLACCQDFEGWLAGHGAAEPAALPDLLLAREAVPAGGEPIHLVGFDDVSPQMVHFIEGLRRRGHAVSLVAEEGAAGTVGRVVFADAEQEAEGAARWARALLEDNPALSIGIIHPRLEGVRPQVAGAFRRILHPGHGDPPAPLFNLSAAPPLSYWGVIHDALAWLRFPFSGAEADAYSALLLSPFLAGAEEEWAERAALDLALREEGVFVLTLPKAERAARELPILARALDGLGRGVKLDDGPPSLWAERLSLALGKVGWPGGRGLDSGEYQAVEAFRALLGSLVELDRVTPVMSAWEAVEALSTMAATTPFQPETPPAPVEILGVLEAAGASFDHLWVMGMTDEAWPAMAAPNPFLPLSLQRERNLPHASPARELAFARAVMGRLLRACPHVLFSHASQDGERELRPSPLIASFPQVKDGLPAWRETDHARRILALRRVERVVEEAVPVTDIPLSAPGGTGLLKDQSLCPFAAFARHRLRAEGPATPTYGLNAMERGQLAHHALDHFFQEVRDQETLAGLDMEARVARVSKAVSAAMIQVKDRLSPAFYRVEGKRLMGLLMDWLAMEEARPPFWVVQTEPDERVTIGPLTIKTRIDRIDRLEGGDLAVIDYKTGDPDPRKWFGARPQDPQLPLYGITRQGRVSGLAFARFKVGKMGFSGVVREGGELPGVMSFAALCEKLPPEEAPATWEEMCDRWRERLAALGEAFLGGRAQVDPLSAEVCKTCVFPALCRVEEEDHES